MKEEALNPVVYVPTMHREYVPDDFPEDIRPLWPGLSARHAGSRPLDLWQQIACPYSVSEAASCLAELERLDEAGLAALADTADIQSEAGREHAERQALRRFAATGGCPQPEVPDGKARQRWAQRFLLLAWLQEERILDMKALAERYRFGAEKLAGQIGDQTFGEGQDAFADLLGMVRDLVPEDTSTLLPSWRFMLELFSILAPEDMLFCTADARMIDTLTAAGLCGEALSPTLRERFSGPLDGYELTCGEVPFWRLVGKKMPQSDRPWLDRKQLVILCTGKEIREEA